MKKTMLISSLLILAVMFAGKASAGEVTGIELREDGTVSVVEKKEICRNPAEPVSGNISAPESPSRELVEVLRETNRILSEIRDELSEIEKDLKKVSKETGLWGRMPVR